MAALLNTAIYGFKNHTRMAFGPLRHVGNSSSSSLVQSNHLKIKSKISPSSGFAFEEYKTLKIERINKALDEAVPLKHPTILHEAMRYTLLAGGERLFSTLCIASCELVGGNESLVMPMACALETMTTAEIVADDLPCMDDDDIRCGMPTNHKVFGVGTSVIACHALIYQAIEHVLTKTKDVEPNRLIQAINEICKAMGAAGVSAGQCADMHSEGKEVSLRELEFIHQHKIEKILQASMVCGTILGGGTEVEIERLNKYGKNVGLAFQVWDDILDVTGSPETLGRNLGGDALRGKATHPKLIGLDESVKFAKQLVADAIQELAYFDSARADPLYHIANSIAGFV
ncbi:hypothetical protein JRO89_XS04G0054400 [Xanthoceras sorbifolium]|uniref:Uncharacterized protein n=1 Tax=Xanthoceras sorbifolium TaxID=99658 RepID=A0ABQ8I475_9ROSI|nr:hypothetical protein JRO89_XS04G0054400 [Xanthoceras sorbifolium]